MLKIVFFGTPNFTLPVLESLHKKFSVRNLSPIAAVVTQSPKPTGRKKTLTYSPIDKWAHQHKINVFYTAQELIKQDIKADLGVLAAYGQILPESIINYFPKGILNIHPSLLPKLRGASPIPASLIQGDKETGVSIIKLDSKMDHGPIVSQFKETIKTDDTSQTLTERLFSKSAEVLTNLIDPYLKGKINLKEQDDTQATFTSLLTKDHGFIPPKYLTNLLSNKDHPKEKWPIPFVKGLILKLNAKTVNNFIKAMYPWPIAWSQVKLNNEDKDTKRLKIISAHLEKSRLILDKVQLEGKNEVTLKDFVQGYPNYQFS